MGGWGRSENASPQPSSKGRFSSTLILTQFVLAAAIFGRFQKIRSCRAKTLFQARLGKGDRHILLRRPAQNEPVPGRFETASNSIGEFSVFGVADSGSILN